METHPLPPHEFKVGMNSTPLLERCETQYPCQVREFTRPRDPSAISVVIRPGYAAIGSFEGSFVNRPPSGLTPSTASESPAMKSNRGNNGDDRRFRGGCGADRVVRCSGAACVRSTVTVFNEFAPWPASLGVSGCTVLARGRRRLRALLIPQDIKLKRKTEPLALLRNNDVPCDPVL